MNRIERLIWEETQLKELERGQRKPHGMTGMRFILIAILVTLIALTASRVWTRPLDDAVVRALAPTSALYMPAPRPNKASAIGPSTATSSSEIAGDVEKAAAHDDPPIGNGRTPATFR